MSKTEPRLNINHALTASLRGKQWSEALTSIREGLVVTMAVGQWDVLLEASYHTDAFLVEVGDDGRIRRVFQKGSK